jgi:hypothetical protein
MVAGGVAEGILEEGQHGVQHFGMHGRGGVVIEVNRVRHGLKF